ncbi:MAG: hypothetical protein IKC32_06915 [Clostridia bacterium]|nr:hypothetical protein [Clostridia bacterium]
MKLQFKRILNFIFQTIFWVPLALLINACAISPFMMISGEMGEPTNVIIFLPIMWGIAFGLSKLRQWLKGRETDEYYDVAYDEVTYTASADYYSDTIHVDANHRYYTQTESSNTFWGWVGIILSFVALPLQLVAWLMSFVSLFFPFIYSTPRALPDDRGFSFFNVLLHTLFDFVIIIPPFKRKNKANAQGLLYSLLFLSVPVVDVGVWFLLAAILDPLLDGLINLEFLAIILLLAVVLIALSVVMLWLKYSFLIVASCSRVEAKKYMRKLGRWSMILGALFCAMIVIF